MNIIKVLVCRFCNEKEVFKKNFFGFTRNACLKKAADFQMKNNVGCLGMEFK